MATVGSVLLAGCMSGEQQESGEQDVSSGRDRRWVMPDEGAAHARTWMAFAADARIWGADLVPEVERNLAAIATAIAHFEPVSMLVPTARL